MINLQLIGMKKTGGTKNHLGFFPLHASGKKYITSFPPNNHFFLRFNIQRMKGGEHGKNKVRRN